EDERKVYDFFQGKDPNLINPYAPRTPSNDGQVGVYDQIGDYDQAEEPNQSGNYNQANEYSQAEEKSIPLREEERVIGEREVEEGSVRQRKVVNTETVEQPIELRREEMVIDREPGSGEKGSPESLGEEEYYIPVYHEEPVIQKQARERERIHVGKRE